MIPYIETARRRGRTTAILNGVLNTPNAYFVVATFEQVEQLQKQYPRLLGRVYSLETMHHLERLDEPVIFDHFATESALSELHALKQEHEELKRKANDQQKQIEALTEAFLANMRSCASGDNVIITTKDELSLEALNLFRAHWKQAFEGNAPRAVIVTSCQSADVIPGDNEDRLKALSAAVKDRERRLDGLWAELKKHVPMIRLFGLDWRHGTLNRENVIIDSDKSRICDNEREHSDSIKGSTTDDTGDGFPDNNSEGL